MPQDQAYIEIATGLTIKARVFDRDNQVWNGLAFEAFNPANLATYDIATVENSGSGRYVFTFPAAIAAGLYFVRGLIGAASAGPAIWDEAIAWNGSKILGLFDIAAAAGSGARTITVTVNDGASPLENARVRFKEGANSFSALTDASGNAVFNLDDATYTVAIYKSGYTFAGSSLVVTADATPTYSMTAIVITPAADPDKSTLSVTCFDENLAAESGAILTLQMCQIPTGDTAKSFDQKPVTLTADVNGLIEVEVARLAKYKISRGTGAAQTITIPDAATCTFTSFLGRESE